MSRRLCVGLRRGGDRSPSATLEEGLGEEGARGLGRAYLLSLALSSQWRRGDPLSGPCGPAAERGAYDTSIFCLVLKVWPPSSVQMNSSSPLSTAFT